MDEESSDHMDEAGIPMLVSGYNIITMGSKIWGPDIYMASNTEWGRISIYGRGGHTHARIKIYKNNCEARKGGPVGYINNHCVYHKGLEGTQIWDILLGWPCLSWKTDALEWQQCYWIWYQRNWWAAMTRVILAMVHWTGYSRKHGTGWIPNTIANAARTSTGT